MPQNRNITLPAGGVWTELTTAAVTAITIANSSGYAIDVVAATAGGLTSAAVDALIAGNAGMPVALPSGQVWTSDIPLISVFSGLAAGVRIYARCPAAATVGVNHA